MLARKSSLEVLASPPAYVSEGVKVGAESMVEAIKAGSGTIAVCMEA